MALQLEDIIATLGDAIADRMKKTTGNQDDGFRLVDRARAAERLSMSVDHFCAFVEPYIPSVSVPHSGKRDMRRWRVSDLQAWADAHVQMR